MTLVLKCLLVLNIFSGVACQDACTSLPAELNGTWTSTNYGTMNISTSALTLSMSKKLITGTTGSYFDCVFQLDTQYVFKMNKTLTYRVGGTNLVLNIYGCFDFQKASTNSYYYYLRSEQEALLSYERFVLISTSSTPYFVNVCDSTVVLDTAEFHTMVKVGFENEAIAAVQCPDPILGFFRYTYTDQTGIHCNKVNTTSIDACNTTLPGELYINNTGCTTKDPFYSSAGSVGCIANVYDSAADIYYTSYYNKDNPFTQATGLYYRFTCVAMQSNATGTVFLSLMPTDCISGQSPTTAPSSAGITGATMILDPISTCVPSPPDETVKTKNNIWLIVFLVPFGVLIVVVVVIIVKYCKCKAMEKRKAREKGILISEEHPLGEMSIALDAPASMERIPNGYIDVHNELFMSPRSMKKKDMSNPMGETSLNLNFRKPSWAGLTPRKSEPNLQIDPFSEMDSGIVMPISPEGSKTVKSLKSRQRSFIFNGNSTTGKGMPNGDAGQQLAITDGRNPYPSADSPDRLETRTLKSEKSFSREALARSQSVYAPSVKAISVRAPSVKTAASVKTAHSGHSHKANSVASNKTGRSIPKMIRSVTSTKIGSVTHRPAGSPKKKKKIQRSKTMVLPTEKHDANDGGMAEYMNAEMQDWGGRSDAGTSRRSTRTKKSKSSKSTPRKSILKKHSKYISTEEFLTEEEIYNQFVSKRTSSGSSIPAGSTAPPGSATRLGSAAPPTSTYLPGSSAPLTSDALPGNFSPVKAPAGRSLQDEYKEMIERNNPKSKLKKVKSTRKPWH